MADWVYYGCCMLQSDFAEVNEKLFIWKNIAQYFFPITVALNADNDRKLTIFDIKSAQLYDDYGQLAHIERAYTLNYYSHN
jgi:hypothetical protein